MKLFRFSGLTLGILILLLQVFLLLNASLVFGAVAEHAKNILIVYFLMEVLILASFNVGLPTLKTKPEDIVYFAVGFIITAIPVMLIPASIMGSFEIVKVGAFAGLLAYAFVTAYCEEIVFRGVIMPKTGLIISSILFGLFHLAILSYAGTLMIAVMFGVIFLSILSFVWGMIAQRFGVMASTGSHLAWNFGAVGILGTLMGV